MADIENPAENPTTFTDDDKFAEEIVETGVIRKTVTRSMRIQEVSCPNCYTKKNNSLFKSAHRSDDRD